jgi:adenosine/AMP kinase
LKNCQKAGESCFEVTKVRFIPRNVELILGQAKFTMKIVQFAANCPRFEDLKLLPCRVQYAVKKDAFHVFVSALGGTDPVFTKENMNDVRFLCEKFGFTALLTQVSDFISTHSVAESESGKGVRGIDEEKFQIKMRCFRYGKHL